MTISTRKTFACLMLLFSLSPLMLAAQTTPVAMAAPMDAATDPASSATVSTTGTAAKEASEAGAAPAPTQFHMLVGTYTAGKSEGIYVYRFDAETGKLSHVHTSKNVANPSFIILSPDARFAYAVNELGGDEKGMVSAFRFDKTSGSLAYLNQQASGGDHPCYLSIDPQGRHVFVGNYTGGNLSVLPVEADGSLGEAMQQIDHKGSSVKEQQGSAHVHSTVLGPQGRRLFVGDLGIDKIKIYPYQAGTAQPLQQAEVKQVKAAPGSGPRHLIFDQAGNYAYVLMELSAQVAVFQHKDGQLEEIQSASMIKDDFTGKVSGAEIRISPDGRFLYASNRAEANEIAIFSINQENGRISLLGTQSTLGETPRNFIIDPTGRYLLAANQGSDSIVVFERNQETGMLTPTGEKIEVGMPVYLTMQPVE